MNHGTLGLRAATPRRFSCCDCGKSYVHSKHLRRHQMYQCKKPPRFRCKSCDLGFYYKRDLTTHMRASTLTKYLNRINCNWLSDYKIYFSLANSSFLPLWIYCSSIYIQADFIKSSDRLFFKCNCLCDMLVVCYFWFDREWYQLKHLLNQDRKVEDNSKNVPHVYI